MGTDYWKSLQVIRHDLYFSFLSAITRIGNCSVSVARIHTRENAVKTQPYTPPTGEARDDAILSATRRVSAGVIPFLIAAFVVLYLLPSQTGRLFAWEIASPLTAALMGAGYLGGAYFFARLLLETRWHRVGAGFLPIVVYTVVMLVTTLLHWDTFDPTRWAFLVWLAIYVLTPVILLLVWRQNRRRDPGTPEVGDVTVPTIVAIVLFIAGTGLVVVAAIMFVLPNIAAAFWPWPLTPLTARVLAGWQLLMGAGALVLARERRWSAWRIPLSSILLWQSLLLIAFIRRQSAFGPAGWLNWYTVFTFAGVAAAAALLLYMDSRRNQQP